MQTLTRILPENRLNGVEKNQTINKPTWDDWYHFRFQPELNKYVEQNFGFRTFFVRLYNQMDYSLFRQAHGSGVVLGKEGYLYEQWFIDSYFGKDYVGESNIRSKIRQLKQVRSYFRQNGKELAILIAPGKAHYFPEYIPDRLKGSVAKNNYQELASGIREAGIPLIDFNQWFLAIKDTITCPLFPKTGTHWSHYGARLASDSLSGFVSSLLNRPLPRFWLKEGWPTDSVLNPEDDLEKLMNLFHPLPRIPLCHPNVVSQPSKGFSLPSAIVIGDSFFWDMFNIPLKDRIFKEVQYWYYNSSVYPESYSDTLSTHQLKFPDVFADKDLVMIMVNPSNIHDAGWGFLERAISELYEPEWQKEYDKMVGEYIQAIRNTPDWEKQIITQAKEQGIPVDSLLRINAIYMVEQYLQNNDLF